MEREPGADVFRKLAQLITLATQGPEMARWSIPQGADLRWYRWDDEYVIHHGLSNDTHRLSANAGLVIEALQSHGPQDESALAEHCEFDTEALNPVLAELADLDLVVRC